jgi:flagellar biosynthesis protein FlhF
MQIKRFEAKSMTAALRLIREELGPEAVILSARSIKKSTGLLGSLQTPGVEVTAATDAYSDQGVKQISSPYQRRSRASQTMATVKMPRMKQTLGAPRIRESKNVQRSLKPPAKRRPESLPEAKKDLLNFYQKLISQGVDRNIALDLTESGKILLHTNRQSSEDDARTLLIALLKKMKVSSDPIRSDRRNPRMAAFVGTTGVGKTTTIAKLAAHYAIDQDKRVALISLDDFRIGAIEQLSAYAKILGVPLEVATNAAELKKHLKAFKAFDFILIDTPGMSHNNHTQMKALQKCLHPFRTIERHLLLSAGTKADDSLDIIRGFQPIGINRFVFSKLDESNSYGNLVNLLVRTQIPFSHLTAGQNVPDDIEDGSIESLAALLLGERQPITRDRYLSSRPKDGNQDTSVIDTDIGMYFIANKNSDVYHRPGCKWTKKIKPKHIIEFESSADAEHRNYQPCRDCDPRREDQSDPSTFERDRITISTYR